MIARAIVALASGCEAVAVSAPPGSGAARLAGEAGLTLLVEPSPGQGPLFGILEGLAWAAREGFGLLVSAPCDLPFLPEGYVRRLTALGEAAAAEDAEGRLQPLCAAWPSSFEGPLRRQLAQSHPPAARLVEAFARVRFTEPAAFRNVNRSEDLGFFQNTSPLRETCWTSSRS